MKISKNFRKCLFEFVRLYSSGDLANFADENKFANINYREEMKTEAAIVDVIFAVYLNNLELDAAGNVLNQHKAVERAAQVILYTFNADYLLDPELEEWELSL